MMFNKLQDIKRWKVDNGGFPSKHLTAPFAPATSLEPTALFGETVAKRRGHSVVGSPGPVLGPGHFMKKPYMTARSSSFSGVS